ncbi:MAG: hypothetical protein ACFFDW_09900 [Candidatus Thorarchaeota archaeon]
MSKIESREDFNRELVETLQKIVNPNRLNRIYDKVISYQNSQPNIERQQYVLGIIKDYIREIDSHFQE